VIECGRYDDEMNWRIRVEVFVFYEMGFSWESQTGSLILGLTRFAFLKIIGFDPCKAEVRDITITIIHDGFFSKVAIWLKTKVRFNGRQWGPHTI
jgi:hypothetical protein